MIKLETGIEFLNYAEAILEVVEHKDGILKIACDNLHVMEGVKDKYLIKKEKEFLGPVYVIYKNVSGFTSEYEESRLLEASKRTCIGGCKFNSNDYSEYWFEFLSANIYILEPSELINYKSEFYNGSYIKNY